MPSLAMISGMAIRTTIHIIIATALVNPVIAQPESTRIVAPILGERLLTQQKDGFWADMYQQILAESGESHELVVLPFKRTLASFASHEFDCTWSFDKNLLSNASMDVTGLLESEIVFEATQHIFLAPGMPAIGSLDELSGKRVGIGSGSSYEKRLKNASAKVVLLSDQNSKLRMLENGRIDAFIGWLPSLLIVDTYATFKSELLSNESYLSSSGAAFVCHDTAANTDFITSIDSAIVQYRKSAEFAGLFDSYGASQMLK